jgi:hypothetical protein
MKKRIRIQVDKKKHGEFFSWAHRIKTKIKNRGTGAGGANTNANGLSYEALTMLPYHIIEEEENHMKIKFHGCDKTFICANQCKFYKYMDSIGVIKKKTIRKAHGCHKPDECYIDHAGNIIFIIEKKFQQGPGSVCEKIQTPVFKTWLFEKTFPDYTIVYMYCLSDWFRSHCKTELDYLANISKTPVFFGSSETYKKDVIHFITNYNNNNNNNNNIES